LVFLGFHRQVALALLGTSHKFAGRAEHSQGDILAIYHSKMRLPRETSRGGLLYTGHCRLSLVLHIIAH
jgi:hypothetical protein